MPTGQGPRKIILALIACLAGLICFVLGGELRRALSVSTPRTSSDASDETFEVSEAQGAAAHPVRAAGNSAGLAKPVRPQGANPLFRFTALEQYYLSKTPAQVWAETRARVKWHDDYNCKHSFQHAFPDDWKSRCEKIMQVEDRLKPKEILTYQKFLRGDIDTKAFQAATHLEALERQVLLEQQFSSAEMRLHNGTLVGQDPFLTRTQWSYFQSEGYTIGDDLLARTPEKTAAQEAAEPNLLQPWTPPSEDEVETGGKSEEVVKGAREREKARAEEYFPAKPPSP